MKVIDDMKKVIKKKKAFTLVELMGVLVIIGVLTAVLIPVISNVIKENKQKMYNTQLDTIKLAAKNFGSDNVFLLPDNNDEIVYINLNQLKKMGYIEDVITNPLTKKDFSDCTLIKITKVEGGYEYQIDENTLESDVCNLNNDSSISISNPSKNYIKKGMTSSYIIIAGTTSDTFVGYTLDESKVELVGEPKNDVKYSITGENGIYKLTLIGGDTEGTISFKLNSDSILDESGNNIVGDGINSQTIIVDNTAPECGTWNGQSTTWTNKPRTITMTGVDSLSPIKEGNTFSKTYSTGEITTDSLSHTVEDVVGNTRLCETVANIYIDTVAPTLVIDAYTYNTSTNGKGNKLNIKKTNADLSVTTWKNYGYYFDISGSSDNSSGVSTHYWYWNNSGSKTLNTTKSGEASGALSAANVNLKGDGYRYAEVTIKDAAGNERKQAIKVMVDKTAPTAPTVTLKGASSSSDTYSTYTSSVSNNTWTSKYVAAKPSGSTDALSGGVYYLVTTSGATTAYTDKKMSDFSTDYKKVDAQGTSTVSFKACDAVGNCSGSVSRTVKIDRTNPVIGDCTWKHDYSYNGKTYPHYLECEISDNFTAYDDLKIKYSDCYEISGSTSGITCAYKSIDDRYKEVDWQSISKGAFLFQTKINSGDKIRFKFNIEDAAGNNSSTATNKTHTHS